MRTTINLSPEAESLLKQYVEYFEARLGPRISMSSVIEEAVNLALPTMFDRIPEKGITPKDFLNRRANEIKSRLLKNDLTEVEVLALMREANRYQDECRTLLLSKGKGSTMEQVEEYQKCLQGFLSAYNAGADRLNKGIIIPKRK